MRAEASWFSARGQEKASSGILEVTPGRLRLLVPRRSLIMARGAVVGSFMFTWLFLLLLQPLLFPSGPSGSHFDLVSSNLRLLALWLGYFGIVFGLPALAFPPKLLRRGLERRLTSNSGPSSHIVSRTGFGSTWRAERLGSSRMDFARESTTLSGWVLDRRQRR